MKNQQFDPRFNPFGFVVWPFRDSNTLLPGAQRTANYRWRLAKKEQEAVDTAAKMAALVSLVCSDIQHC